MWRKPSEFVRFLELFSELDGGDKQQRFEVTLACVEALFDRLVNPPMLDDETPTIEDVDAAERSAVSLISAEAEKVRAVIRSDGHPE